MSEPFTLRVFVPSGNPEATRIVEKMNSTGRGYYVPRDDWNKVRTRAEIACAGAYILLGHEQDELGAETPIAYIGQTDNLRDRLDDHDKKNDFWENMMFFMSTNGGLNRAHIRSFQEDAVILFWLCTRRTARHTKEVSGPTS